MSDNAPPLTDEQFEKVANTKWSCLGVRTFNVVVADARRCRADLAKARAEAERLRALLKKAVDAYPGWYMAALAALAPEAKEGTK